MSPILAWNVCTHCGKGILPHCIPFHHAFCHVLLSHTTLHSFAGRFITCLDTDSETKIVTIKLWRKYLKTSV